MATPTYDPIASTTLTLPASSVTFSSLDTIAAGYRDLVLVAFNAGTNTASIGLRFNSDSGNNYNTVNMYGDGSSPGSYSISNFNYFEPFVNGAIANHIWQFMDYSATDKHKSILARMSGASNFVAASAGRWANTSAITSITIVNSTWAAGSTFSLYGISA